MRPGKYIVFTFCFLFAKTMLSKTVQPVYPDSEFSTYYIQRDSHFRTLPKARGDIIFLGNSITDGGEWAEIFADLKVKNREISGDFTAGILSRLDEVYSRLPTKAFLIGINDLAKNVEPGNVVKNILCTSALIKDKSLQTELYFQSLFPVNEKVWQICRPYQ